MDLIKRKKILSAILIISFSFFHFGYTDWIAKNLSKGNFFLDLISFSNIDIIQNWITEKENFLDKDNFDMNWEVDEEFLITFSKIINDEEVIFEKITKLLFHQMKTSENKLVFLENL